MKRKWLKHYDTILAFVVLIVLLYFRFQLGLVRYFDIDEFAHLHWGYDFFAGAKPYRDFLYFFPPGFLFFLWPLFAFLPHTAVVLTGARVLAFAVFVLLLAVLFLLVWEVRNTKTALMSVVLLAFLPLPSDKFMEIRPDTLATVFAMAGMYFFIKSLNPKDQRLKTKDISVFLSGLFYGLGMMVVPKVVFFLIIAVAIVLFEWLAGKTRSAFQAVLLFSAGLFVPVALTLAVFVSSGEMAKAIYLTTVFVSTSSRVLGAKFYMFPSHFFYPNDAYYGEAGVSVSLVANLTVYMAGIIWGIMRFVAFLDGKDRKASIAEFLIAGTFLANILAFIKLFPLKHAQYWIPVVPFVAFFAADWLTRIGNWLKMRRFEWVFSISLVSLVLFIGIKSYQIYEIKSKWVNTQTYTELDTVYKTIPKGEYVWDLFGQTIFYKDPYYVCCIPYGQYEEAFGFSLPPLARALEQTNTRYVFAHNPGRLGVLPGPDRVYLEEHFEPLVNNPLILVRKK